ncbi:nucleoside triphosphate pyrophosphohydrolase [Thalassoroseus pseudoceratinae]|uniref:nucleoside triphosphate pyrophosphohydrolase n=1 Tax=Thalassoroseus pseudoceratinae TaxID=2713176 RepID=UPI001F0EF643|nr:nucleoside triphosphate pyrophosphohydrolase [Thalassoroseus pseudoceratinae]
MNNRPTPSEMGHPPAADRVQPAFQKFCEVVARLRAPDGCPWDREQTLETIKPYTLEETYELLEAIDSGDDASIVEELGDVLLQVVLDAQVAADERRFDIVEVIEVITAKMIRRHPHVFGEVDTDDKMEIARNWERIKQSEKPRNSILDGIPLDLPQLARAARISKKAARVGYDFPQREMLFDKLTEEINELANELFENGEIPQVTASVDTPVVSDAPVTDPEQKARIESELGDVLFVLANIARRWGINPEEALRSSNRKFTQRFQHIEQAAKESGLSLHDMTLTEMESAYQQAKQAAAQNESG